MPANSDRFGGPAHSWAVNFRVKNIDLMVGQLRGAGVEVDIDLETYPNGRFASLRDPEGNAIQLWQPDGADLRGST
ncbi:MAG: VOC family protein [Nocardioidaceae bacterium]